MARYGTGALYGDGHVYGESVGTLVGDEAVLAGESPALPDRRVAWRDATATIWGFDPVTWLPTDQLERVAISATRTGTLSDTGRQTETLAFDVAAPLTLTLEEGTWLCVQWSVEIPTGSTTFLGGVFRVSAVPSTDQDDAGTLYHVNAVDWFSYVCEFRASATGWIAFADLETYLTTYTDAGGVPIPDGETALASMLAAYIWRYASSGDFEDGQTAPFYVIPWSGFRFPVLQDVSPVAAQVTSPGQRCRIGDVVAWFWPLVAGYTLAYAADGGLILSGRTPSDSGLYVTLDTTPLGSVPLPSEAAPQALTPPPYTTVAYQRVATPSDTPSEPGLFDGTTWQLGSAYAQHWSGATSRIEQVIDTDHSVTLGGFESANAWCAWRLQGYLGAAQTISLTVDSAYPPPPLGRLVAVQLIAGDAGWPRAGYYRVTAFSQPLHMGGASWTLQWWSDLNG